MVVIGPTHADLSGSQANLAPVLHFRLNLTCISNVCSEVLGRTLTRGQFDAVNLSHVPLHQQPFSK